MAQINKIKFITAEELKSMPLTPFEITKSIIQSKDRDVKRESFLGVVKLDPLTPYKINLSPCEFALLLYHTKGRNKDNNYIPSHFKAQARVRLVETQWPENGDRKANSTYELQVYVNDDLKWESDITDSDFLKAVLTGNKEGFLKEYVPVIRIPGKQEKEVSDIQDLQEEAPEDN